MNYGLALAGGGTRGAAHVGVLKALAEENLLPTSIAGTSAGSIVAGLYASGLCIDKIYEAVSYLTHHGLSYLDPDYLGLIQFIPQILLKKETSLTGLLKGNKMLHFLHGLVGDKTILDLPICTVIPAVDIKTGNTIAFTNFKSTSKIENVIWEKNGFLCDIMMASSSVPSVFCPRKINEYCLVDGGVTNNLPVDILIAAGEKKVIAVDIGVDYETPHDNSIMEIVSHSFSIMSRSLKDCMSSGEILLLNPPLPKDAGLLTFQLMEDCVEKGYQYTKKKIPEIKKRLMKTVPIKNKYHMIG